MQTKTEQGVESGCVLLWRVGIQFSRVGIAARVRILTDEGPTTILEFGTTSRAVTFVDLYAYFTHEDVSGNFTKYHVYGYRQTDPFEAVLEAVPVDFSILDNCVSKTWPLEFTAIDLPTTEHPKYRRFAESWAFIQVVPGDRLVVYSIDSVSRILRNDADSLADNRPWPMEFPLPQGHGRWRLAYGLNQTWSSECRDWED